VVKVHCTTMVLAGLNYLLEFNWCCLSSISSDKVPSSMSPKEAPLLICGRLTRLCGLPPTRPRQTSDPVSPGKRQPHVSSSLRIFGIRLSARHICFKKAGFSERSSRCPCKIDDYCPIGLRRFLEIGPLCRARLRLRRSLSSLQLQGPPSTNIEPFNSL